MRDPNYIPPPGPPPSYNPQAQAAPGQQHVSWTQSGSANRSSELASSDFFNDAYHKTSQDQPPPSSGLNYNQWTSSGDRKVTNCHTCRLRKKKCDGGRPTCDNCAKGGFDCAGYDPKPSPPNYPRSFNRTEQCDQWIDYSIAGPQEGFAPPPGAPPSYQPRANSPTTSQYQKHSDFMPPPGPPPSHKDPMYHMPPPGPPPSHLKEEEEDAPPPYDPWLAVPDSTLLPPPPSIREERSQTSNASWDDAARGHAWCKQNPLWQPRRHDQQTLMRIAKGDVRLTTPPNAKAVQLSQTAVGRTNVKTDKKCTDTILLSDIPLYTATLNQPKTIYYEILIKSMGESSRFRSASEEAAIAIGFAAPPYPFWRLPGWHRASLAVHGDDGRRYVDDSFGGKDFTAPFKKNDVVGIGLTFSPPLYADGKNRVEAFFTRNGKKEGSWSLHEERDREQDGGDAFGLEGEHDILAAVGCFGAVEFECRFRREERKFRLSA